MKKKYEYIIIIRIPNSYMHLHIMGYFHLIEHCLIEALKINLSADNIEEISGYTVYDHILIRFSVYIDRKGQKEFLQQVNDGLVLINSERILNCEKEKIMREIMITDNGKNLLINRKIIDSKIEFMPIGSELVRGISFDDLNEIFMSLLGEYNIIEFLTENGREFNTLKKIKAIDRLSEEIIHNKICVKIFRERDVYYLISCFPRIIINMKEYVLYLCIGVIMDNMISKYGDISNRTTKVYCESRYSLTEFRSTESLNSIKSAVIKEIKSINSSEMEIVLETVLEWVQEFKVANYINRSFIEDVYLNNLLYSFPMLIDESELIFLEESILNYYDDMNLSEIIRTINSIEVI